jgi:hypothetical protein
VRATADGAEAGRRKALAGWRKRRHGLGRPAGRIERSFEALAIRRMGWDVALFRGERAPDVGPIEPYRIVHPAWVLPRRRDRAFDAIVVGAWAQFGNAVQQLANAIVFAGRYGASRILVPADHPIFLPTGSIGALRLAAGTIETPAPRETALAGRFFLCPAGAHRPDLLARYACAHRHVRALIRPAVLDPDARVGADDVVAHVRSGDVFTRKVPNPEYGQPPLAFYLGAIRATGARRVWLVYENLENPIITVLAERLRADGVDVVEQSASLVEDLRVLLSARRLVVGFGTMTDAVTVLSLRLTDLHVFGNHVDLRAPGTAVSLHRTVDRGGRYVEEVQSDNWRSSPAQQRLMLDYPAEQLAIVSEGPRTAGAR